MTVLTSQLEIYNLEVDSLKRETCIYLIKQGYFSSKLAFEFSTNRWVMSATRYLYNPQNTDLDITKVHIMIEDSVPYNLTFIIFIYEWILTSPFALLKKFLGKIST